MSLTVNALKTLDIVNGDGEESVPFDRGSRRSSVISGYNPTKGRKQSVIQARRDSKWSLISNHLAMTGVNSFLAPSRSSSPLKPWKQHTNGGGGVKPKEAAPVQKIANTYKMTPDSDCLFRPGYVEEEVKKILDTFFTTRQPRYDPSDAGYMTTTLTELVKAKVKDLGFRRHKLIVQVFLGSKENQSMEMASRCVWDSTTDNFVTVSWQNGSIFAIANVYGIYYE